MSKNETPASGPVYLYGIVAAGSVASLDAEGVAGKPLELIEHDDVAAVVSAFPATDFRVRRRDLIAHLRSIEHVFASTTIAPFPFGTVMLSAAAARDEILEPHAAQLRQLLERLEGHVQMNVKGDYDEERVLREIVAHDPEVGRARERATALGDAAYYENIRLGELVSARVAERRARDAAEIAARLGAVAADFVTEPVDDGGVAVFKGSFLVGRDALGAFDEALDGLAEASGHVRFEVTGPLPPVAFASLEPGVASWA